MYRLPRLRLPLILLAFGLLLAARVGADERKRALAILGGDPQSRSPEALLTQVEQQQLSNAELRRFEDAIADLRSDTYLARQRGTMTLARLGPRIQSRLAGLLADHAGDMELRARLEHIQQKLAATDVEMQTWAAALLLTIGEPLPVNHNAAHRLFSAFQRTRPGFVQAAIREAVCRHVLQRDQEWLEDTYVSPDSPAVDAGFALVLLRKLELDTGQPALQPQRSCVSRAKQALSRRGAMKLAAVRVLSTSLEHLPLATEALLELAVSEDRYERAEAFYLLESLFEAHEESKAAFADVVRWRRWVNEQAWRKALTASQAFRWGVRFMGIREDFDTTRSKIQQGFGPFTFHSTTGAQASVQNGKLILPSSDQEGDQRLSISARQLVGDRHLRRPFTVEVGIGGTAGNPIGWHVGTAVGKAKFLFHLDYAGGSFRVEDLTTHTSISSNETMPFTPQSNVTHKMLIDVQPLENGSARVAATIWQGGQQRAAGVFRWTRTLQKEQIGAIDQISLVRSGRSGGNAQFDYLEVRPR